eukprot:scaffold61530_cov51-Attheya_sp.AAC.5
MSPKQENNNESELTQKQASQTDVLTKVPWTVLVGLGTLLVCVASHAGAWEHLFSSISTMKANAAAPDEFTSAMEFWLFAVLIHPLLQPIFWISEVLHASPGPKIADLVPISFLCGNVAFIAIIWLVQEIRATVMIVTLSALVAYIGSGLDGQAGLGDYNIQLDDDNSNPQTTIVRKGCPAPEEVQLSSVNNFNLQKYKGHWYWHKVHDWTQFKEVYDTTLDISLTDDGKGYVNKLNIKAPSPQSSPLAWDKSPLANGASYTWSGKINVDSTDRPGVTQETGFGVKFPNYVVDVQTDKDTGEYQELIQFQCIEVGGVRLYEGIDFMSRSPEMSDAQLTDMHSRAEKAGLYPYGASPEQMHRIERRPVDATKVDNSWQALWKSIGIDTILEQLSGSTEQI